MLLFNKQQRFLLKLVSLFSLVRGYNIIVLIIAQYLTARYILAPQLSWWTLLFDIKFFSIVIASALTTAAGYIINNFYDASKDQINRPKKYILEHLVSQQIQLVLFLILNMMAFIFASIVSFRAVLFFLLYMFAIWIYSFRVKRLFWLSNLYSALLMILPFWAITLYFKNFDILVVDVEGNEEDVLNSFSIEEWRPKMMIIEIEDENGQQTLRRVDPKDIMMESDEEPQDVTFSEAIHVEAKPDWMQHN